LLNDCRAGPDRTARGHVANAQFYEVASAELRVDRAVEERKITQLAAVL